MTRSTHVLVAAGAAVALAATACHRGATVADSRGAASAVPADTVPGEVRLDHLPDFVKVAEVKESRDASFTTATGRVGFDEERVSRVAAPVSGRVVELLARPGDRVVAGQGLLAIASPDAESAVADWVAAVADQQVASRNLERQRRLYEDQATAKREVEQAESDATKAAAALARARGRLKVLGIDAAGASASSRFALRAPIAGVVVERPAFPGMEVRADSGTPLITVADLSRVWVLADVYERDLGRVAVGEKATVQVPAWPDRRFEGTVTHVGEVVDPQTRTVKVRVEVANPKLELKPEMFARVSLAGPPGRLGMVTVPSQAIVSDGEGTSVIVDEGGGRFQRRIVESGAEVDGRVRVLSGLEPGERVVVDGAIYLHQAIEGT